MLSLFYSGRLTESEEEEFDTEVYGDDQEFDSSNTSINSSRLPAIFKLVKFKPNTLNLDWGGGKYDIATEYLKTLGVTNLIHDKYNRTSSHNQKVLIQVRKHGGADTVTCSNVLNVIAEESERLNVIKNCAKFLKPNGTAYFTVYEGNGSGKSSSNVDRRSHQQNRKTATYVDEIKQVFKNVTRKGKLIIAKK